MITSHYYDSFGQQLELEFIPIALLIINKYSSIQTFRRNPSSSPVVRPLSTFPPSIPWQKRPGRRRIICQRSAAAFFCAFPSQLIKHKCIWRLNFLFFLQLDKQAVAPSTSEGLWTSVIMLHLAFCRMINGDSLERQ